MITEQAKPGLATSLPEGYTVRPASWDDLEAVAALDNACSRELYGRDETQVEDLKREWETPGFKPEELACLVFGPDGQAVGYAEYWNTMPPYVRGYANGRVHPAHRGRGVGRYLLGWQEDMLRSLIGLAPQGAQVVMQAETSINNPHAQALYRRAGMEAIRYFWRMEIDLDEPPAEAVWPEGIALRTIQPGEDERDVYQVLRAAFKDHWGFIEAPFEEAYQRWRHWGIEREDYDPSLRFLAMDGERIAGACMCLPRIWDDADCGFIATLGVHRDYRKRGLGLALLLHSLGEFHRRGTRRAGLGVDAGSLTGATRLYEKAGMRVAREYATYQKVLREGVDLSTQASGG